MQESGERWWRLEHESSECEGKRNSGWDIICKAYIPTKNGTFERLSDGSTSLVDLYYCLNTNNGLHKSTLVARGSNTQLDPSCVSAPPATNVDYFACFAERLFKK